VQSIEITGSGTPVAAGTFQFPAVADAGGSSCSFSVEFSAPPDCSSPVTDPRDGKSYNTVLISGQCWMAQNLNTGNRINLNQEQTNNGIIEKSCFNNDEANCTVYGGMYQWGESVQYLNGASNTTSWSPLPAGNVTGICPSGWHIPSQYEYEILSENLGGDNVSGGKLKEAGTVHWWSPNVGATNSSGFTALPTGNLNLLPGTSIPRQFTVFGTSTEESTTDAYDNSLYYHLEVFDMNRVDVKTGRNAIRCLKN
jgi:uncharacterized protein (TIGR02145 family)